MCFSIKKSCLTEEVGGQVYDGRSFRMAIDVSKTTTCIKIEENSSYNNGPEEFLFLLSYIKLYFHKVDLAQS